MAAINAQAAAMGGQLLDIPYTQARRLENPLDREQREVGKVFVINRVELSVLDQPHQVRKLQRDRALWFECGLQAAREIVDVGHMRVDIVARDEISLPACRGQL